MGTSLKGITVDLEPHGSPDKVAGLVAAVACTSTSTISTVTVNEKHDESSKSIEDKMEISVTEGTESRPSVPPSSPSASSAVPPLVATAAAAAAVSPSTSQLVVHSTNSKSNQVPVSSNSSSTTTSTSNNNNNNNNNVNQSATESNINVISSSSAPPTTTTATTGTAATTNILEESILAQRNIAKFVVATGLANNNNQLIPKAVNSPLITVLNTSGPLTVLRSVNYGSVVSTTTPHYTFVNTSTLNVTNAPGGVGVKTPTITVLNCGSLQNSMTVVKALTAHQTQQLQQQQHAALGAAAGMTVITEKPTAAGAAATATATVVDVGTAIQAANVIENRGHNVFVKNSTDSDTNNIVLSSKFITGTAANVINKATVNGQRNKVKLLTNVRVPGQPHQQNVVFNQLSKVLPSKYTMTPRPKLIGVNGSTATKFVTKPVVATATIASAAGIAVAAAPPLAQPQAAGAGAATVVGGQMVSQIPVAVPHTIASSTKILKPVVNSVKPMQEKNPKPLTAAVNAVATAQPVPVQKGLIKTISSNYMVPKPPQQHAAGVRTLTSQNKPIPGHIQRTGGGIRTIPPQRSQKFPPTKTNYIGKHAAQAQKQIKHVASNAYPKIKPIKPMNSSNSSSSNSHSMYRHHNQMHHHHHHPPPQPQQQQQPLQSEKQLIFNQVLNAHIVESLKSTSVQTSNQNHSVNYNNAFTCPGDSSKPLAKPAVGAASTTASMDVDTKQTKSDLDTLSLICQAVLLDHNYSCNPNESTATMKEHTRSLGVPAGSIINNHQSSMNSSNLYGPNKRRMLVPPSPPTQSQANVHAQQQQQLASQQPLTTQQPMASSSAAHHQHQHHHQQQQTQQHHHHHHGTSTNNLMPSSYISYFRNGNNHNNNNNNNKSNNNNPQQQHADDDDAASDISDGSDRKHDTEGEETDTAPEVEDVKNDEHYGDYVTRCICGFLHDDGYMVQCDKCKVWQHVQCVVKNRQIPEEYLCELCDKSKPVDKQKARLVQQQWLKDRQYIDQKIRKLTKIKQDESLLSDTDSSDNEQHPTVPPIKHVPKNRNAGSGGGGAGRKKSDGTARNVKKDQVTREPVQRRQKRKERKTTKRKTRVQAKHQQQSQSDEESQDLWTTHLPQLRQWLEKYEEAVTNHYSPELRARILSIRTNGAHMDSNLEYDPTVSKCRVHTQPLTEFKYIVSTVQLAAGMPVIELRGKYMLSTQHRNHSGGGSSSGGATGGGGGGGSGGGSPLTTRQHTQRPGPFLFFYKLHKDNTEVCVDTRTYGNSARFIRRSCRPNAELRHCIEKGVLHLFVVSIAAVEKNVELTIKHESHDLAAVGTTQIACACGRPDTCLVNKTTIKKNGEVPEITKRRRGRRTAVNNSLSSGTPPTTSRQPSVAKETLTSPSPAPSPDCDIKSSSKDNNVLRSPTVNNKTSSPIRSPPASKVATPTTKLTSSGASIPSSTYKEIKVEKDSSGDIENGKMEIRVKKEIKNESDDEVAPNINNLCRSILPQLKAELKKDSKVVKEEKPKIMNTSSSPTTTPMSTRRSSYYRPENIKEENLQDSLGKESTATDKMDIDINLNATSTPTTNTKTSTPTSFNKPSREERKLAAILRAIEQMEKDNQKKQENKAKQANRRESESGSKDEDKIDVKVKRRRRRGRTRTTSSTKRNRLNSTDSYLTSGDENLLSPTDSIGSQKAISGKDDCNKADALLLATSLGNNCNNIDNKQQKSPTSGDGIDSTRSSPESSFRLSSACLLVQAAVEPLESGFKFPKTKKGLMNEWLNKVPEALQSGSTGVGSNASSPVSATVIEDSLHQLKTAKNINLSPSHARASPPNNNACEPSQQKGGNAKKRWLRQAISEDHSGDSLTNRADSPTASVSETVAPPKKRRLARESLSSDNTPPNTPTRSEANKILEASENSQNSRKDETTTIFNEIPVETTVRPTVDNSTTILTIAPAFTFSMPPSEEKQDVEDPDEYESKTKADESPTKLETKAFKKSGKRLLDPRLNRDNAFVSNNQFLGSGNVDRNNLAYDSVTRKSSASSSLSASPVPAKKKLSITEYRERKKLSNDKLDGCGAIGDQLDADTGESQTPEDNSCDSYKMFPTVATVTTTTLTTTPSTRSSRFGSSSSSGSASSCDENSPSVLTDVTAKAPAFNSEPTELERQTEITTLRLKKVFGLPLDTNNAVKSAVHEMFASNSKTNNQLNSFSLSTFNIASTLSSATIDHGSIDEEKKSPQNRSEKQHDSFASNISKSQEENDEVYENKFSEKLNAEIKEKEIKTNTEAVESDEDETSKPDKVSNLFYTPDDDDDDDDDNDNDNDNVDVDECRITCDTTDEDHRPNNVNYVPPFNNPVYPNSNFTSFTSSIDDDSRYQSRNPSPPPDLDGGPHFQ